MITRYDVRNACYKMKNGKAPNRPDVAEEITKLLGDFKWDDFGNTWDAGVKGGKVVVFPSVKDINIVTEVCAKKSLVVEMSLERDWTPEEDAVINMIEAQFLEGIMTWENYKKRWSIKWDNEQNRIVTFLHTQQPIQIEVTQEMVDAKLKESIEESEKLRADATTTNKSTSRPMTESEKELYKSLMKRS